MSVPRLASLGLWAFLLCCLLCGSAPAQGASPAAWKSRTIYQLLTDRFAQTSDGSYVPCNNLSNYCGGSFQGIINHLDYITGMGFDAIWISPIVTNTPGGYHGYWSQDLFGINPHFGTADDLRQLISACHARGVWVMLDVVANHMGGNVPMSQLSPFNQSEHYHRCVACPSNCQINDYTCFQPEVQLCKLAGLPDLNQTNPYVKSQLITWIRTLMDYGFDGLRIDTVPEIEPGFWVDFVSAANTYAVGEVFSDLSCCATYQKQALPGVLSYPLFWTLRSVFQQRQSMNQLQSTFSSYQSQFAKEKKALKWRLEADLLSRELRYTQQVVASELAGWQSMHDAMARQAVKDYARGMVLAERMRLQGMQRALRTLREGNPS